MWTVTQVTTYIRPITIQQKLDLSNVLFGVHLEEMQIWAVLCLCVEWIIISYLTGSHWPILFLPQTPKQHSGPLESTLGLDEFCLWHKVIGTRTWLPSKDNICQSSLVSNLYCLLHSAASTFFFFFLQRWGFRFNLKIPVKSAFMFLITLKMFKGYSKCF